VNWDRLEVDAFFDLGNWNLGFAVQWDGIPEGYARYRIGVFTLGPLVVLATYRV
jgi:hypothetical protein